MAAGYWLRSAGYPLECIAAYGDVETTWAWGNDGGGLASVTWKMDLPYDFDHIALRRGARVEVMVGAQRVGQAELGEPGRTETGRSFAALGIYRSAEQFLCFDGDLETTTIANVAIDRAQDRGCPLRRSGSISGTALKAGDVTDGLNYLNQLLTALAIETGKRWWVDADAYIRLTDDGTTPDWHLVPGVSDPSIADDEYASSLFGRYLSGATLSTAVANDLAAAARFGYAEQGIDMTGLGSMTGTRANARLAGVLKRGKSRLSFADRLEVDSTQLLTRGGCPASLDLVRGGHVVRAFGLDSYSHWLNGRTWLDFVVGEAIWANGADTVSIAPVGLAARTYEDLLIGKPRTSLNS